jgi:prephenate dehydrogenase
VSDLEIKKLVVFGVGLIGGSFAAALKKAKKVQHIVGVGRSRENLERALKLGLIDEVGGDIALALKNADFVLLAVPMGQMTQVFAAIVPYLGGSTVVTDVGSTKGDVILVARTILGERFSRFVPAHPIAGAEHSGADAARPDLFIGKKVIVTPEPETEQQALRRVVDAWTVCEAEVVTLTSAEHDKVLAAVSHLPHVLAYGLVDMIAAQPNAEQLFEFAAGGFKDFTRIASSSVEMWRDICMGNRDALLHYLNAYQLQLEQMIAFLETGDTDAIARTFAKAREARERWLAKKT